MKLFCISFLLSLLRFFAFVIKIIGRLFTYIVQPLRWCIKKVFTPLLLFFYKQQIIIMQRWKIFSHSTHRLLSFFTHRLSISLGMIVLCSGIITLNLIKEATAHQGGQFASGSLLASVAFQQTDLILTGDQLRANDHDWFSSEYVLIDRPLVLTGAVGESPVVDPYAFGVALQSPDAMTKTARTRTAIETYVVQPGDTASTIAQQFSLSIQTILDANDISDVDLIKPGQQLTILPVDGVKHTVKEKETLADIATEYNAKKEEILEFNNLRSQKEIAKGMELIIPDGRMTPPVVPIAGIASSGVLPSSTASYTGGHIWPTTATTITSHFGYRWGGFHTGTDIAGTLGDPVWASAPGTVVAAGWNSGGYGNMVLIDHGNGVQTRYGHLNSISVSYGQSVAQGEEVGKEGTTGWSTGPHLHYECIISGATVNPLGNCL